MKLYFFEENIDKMGGVERVISTLANNLVNDYPVNVISLRKTSDKGFFKYDDRVLKIYIDTHNYFIKWKNNKNIILKKLYSIWYRFNNLFLISKKRKIFKNITCDDVLIFGRIQVALKWINYLKKDYKIIIRDANHYYCLNNKEKKSVPNLLNNYTNLLIVSSDESKRVYESILNKNVLVEKIYNPLGINPVNSYDYDSKTIIAIGRMDKQKGFEVLLESFKMVLKKHKDWTLKIVGAKSSELVNLINSLNISSNVLLVSETSDITNEMLNSSMCVMTSRYEGYANSLVEALASSIPSISFDWLLGVNEIIDNKKNGEIVKLKNRYDYFNGIDSNDNIVSLTKNINYLIEHREILDTYSKEASKIIESRKKDIIINKWKEEIERLKND